MGGKNSVLQKPLGSTGDKVLGKNNFFNDMANLSLSPAGLAFSQYSPISIKNTLRNVGEGLGEITGSNALRKQAMDQQQRAEEEAKRTAALSDAMARNAGGDATSIFIGGGARRKRGGAGGGATGSAGTGNSRDTGVQS